MKKILVFWMAFVFIHSSILWAGGWSNMLMGARAMAIGGAFSAVADDPSAIFHNPAGLSFQNEGLQFSLDGFYVWPTHDFVTPSGTRAQSKWNNAIPQIFVSYKVNEKTTVGFGAYVPYAGGGVDWKKEDLGIPLKSYMGVYCLTPALSYQLSNRLSLGFELNFYRALLSVDTEVPNVGQMNTEESGSSLSASLGLLFRPSQRVAFGLSIRGPSTIKLSGESSFVTVVPGLGTIKFTRNSETDIKLPWDLEIGFSFRLAENFLFSTGAQYTLWSVLDKVHKKIEDVPFLGDIETDEVMNFKDILVLRAGLEYLLPGGIALRGGIGYDPSATPNESLNERNIDVDKLSLLGGIGYRAGRMQIDFVYIYVSGKEREKTITNFGFPLTTRYNLNVNILGLGVTFSF